MSFTQPFEYLVATAARVPESVAISTPDTEMTFAELLDTSQRMARLLRESGIRPGDVVAVRGPALVELVAAFAIFHEAAVGTNVPAGYLEGGGTVIDWILTTAPLDTFPRDKQIVLDGAAMQSIAGYATTDAPLPYGSADAACRLPFSSGTTGRPKPVPLSVDALEERCIDRRDQWMLERPYFCHLGLSTGLTFMTFYACVIEGETYISPGTGTQILEQLQKHRVACLIASPHQLSQLFTNASRQPGEFPHLKIIMSAGAAMPDFLAKNLERRFQAQIVVTFASTEAGTLAIRSGTNSPNGYAGDIVGGIDVKIAGEDGRALPDGEVGLIAVRRARQPMTYLAEPEATAHSFRGGYFYSGDTGYLEDNRLFLAGRASELINAAGIKVDPARVESAAYEFAGIEEAAAFGYSDQRGLDTIALVFVAREPVALDDLLSLLRSRLGESAPTRLARVDNIPRNHMGKVNRDELARLFSATLSIP